MSNVKVAVRCRPFNKREIKLETDCVINMKGSQTFLLDPKSKHERPFNFDHSFWTFNKKDPNYTDQTAVFDALGPDIMENVFEGFNACVFAYGQTGSGKTYTMMGTQDEPGIIPRICTGLYDRINDNKDPNISFKVEVSYMEIYNEKVADLLAIRGAGKKELKVREHKVMGPYVEGLARLAVAKYDAIKTLMDEGGKHRHVAKTKMNDTSSRSHAVFTVFFTQAMYDPATKQTGERVSRINLVDLAGSERNKKTGTKGAALKEGANINKSLTTLGLVISALAERSKKGKQKNEHIPFRDSTLTWLLKDNLGGNAKTVMVATLSPAADNYDETLSTLRYADRAKAIVNHAIVNEDPNQRLIRELREELERLRTSVGGAGGAGGADPAALAAMQAQMAETEALMATMNQSWEEKLAASERHLEEHRKMLEEHGASVRGDKGGLRLQSSLPHLVSIGDEFHIDIAIYTLQEGYTRIGSYNGDPSTLQGDPDDEFYDEPPKQDIILTGKGIQDEHCLIQFKVDQNKETGSLREVVTLFPIADAISINQNPRNPDGWLAITDLIEEDDDDGGKMVGVELHHANSIMFGTRKHTFRFNHPVEAQRMLEERAAAGGDADSDDDMGPGSPASELALPGSKLKEMEAKLEEEKRQQLAAERERMAAEREAEKAAEDKARRERDELMERKAAAAEATIAAKKAEADRVIKESQAMLAEALAAKEAAEAERQRFAERERVLAAQKQAETEKLMEQMRLEAQKMEDQKALALAKVEAEMQAMLVEHEAQSEAVKESESSEMNAIMAAKMAEFEAKLAAQKSQMEARQRKQDAEYKQRLASAKDEQSELAAELARARAAGEAAATAASIDEDEAEELRAKEAAKLEAQKNKQQAGGAAVPATFVNDPHFSRMGLSTGADLFAKPSAGASGGPVRRGSRMEPFNPSVTSNGLPPKIPPFAGNPFAPKTDMTAFAGANPFAPVQAGAPASNPFGAQAATAFGGSGFGSGAPIMGAAPGMTGAGGAPGLVGAPGVSTGPTGTIPGAVDPMAGGAMPFATPTSPGQTEAAAAAAGDFFSSIQTGAAPTSPHSTVTSPSNPFAAAASGVASPTSLGAASRSTSRGGGASDDDGFNPDSWKPGAGKGKANAGGYITYKMEEEDDDDDDDESSDDEYENSTKKGETDRERMARVMREKAAEILALQEQHTQSKKNFEAIQERQRTESQSKKKKGLLERFRR